VSQPAQRGEHGPRDPSADGAGARGEGLGDGGAAVPETVRLEGLNKRFEAVHAVRDVNLGIRAGEIVALVGENGAGKSTVVRLLAGLTAPDSGSIVVGGRAHARLTPRLALESGIGLVQQELANYGALSVAENLVLGNNPPTRMRLFDHAQVAQRVSPVLSALGVDVDLRQRVETLNLATAQLIEVAKHLLRDPRVLILDEATSALNREQAAAVYRAAQERRRQGAAALLITHRLEELAYADRVVVMRDGSVVGELQGSEIEEDAVVRLMLGREITTLFPAPPPRLGATPSEVLRVQDLRLGTSGSEVSLRVHGGEIVGIGGLSGQGQRDLFRWIFGSGHRSGELYIRGNLRRLRSPVGAVKEGIAYVPEDRKREALLTELTVEHNMLLPRTVDGMCRFGFLQLRRLGALIRRSLEDFHVVPARPKALTRQLSGGNQQKVALARWWMRDPLVYLLEDPTRGVDIGSKAEIYRRIINLAESGAAILMTSSDTLELVNLCHRAIVLYEGEVVGEYSGESLTEERLVSAAVTGRAA
jgi:ABC-type sugar transport system ATPase subunit